MLTWSTGTAFGALLRGINDACVNLPVGSSPGNMTYNQLEQYRTFLPKELYFPSYHGFVVEAGRSPVHDAQVRFATALRDAGLRIDSSYLSAWDATWLVIDALRHVGVDAPANRIGDYLEHLRGWSGVLGSYDFTDPQTPNQGIGVSSALIYRWDPAAE